MAAIILLAAGLAGCGGGAADTRTAASKNCQGTIGLEAPTATPVGRQQLTYAQLAVADDNQANHTRISLAPENTRADPALARAATNAFAVKSKLVAVVGPATGSEVQAVGPILARAGMAFVSGSATQTDLTTGANPTFFRVVPSDSAEGPAEARFVLAHLHPREVSVVTDGSPYATAIVEAMLPVLRAAKVGVDLQPAAPPPAAVAPLAARLAAAATVVFLAWQDPLAADRLGRTLLRQRRTLTLVGPDRLYAPGAFTMPGAYVAAYGPDASAIPTHASILRRNSRAAAAIGPAGAPAYAATHVIDEAIARVCRAGQTPSRGGVLASIRSTNQPSSVLGLPIRFQADGNLADARWFMYRITPGGGYRLVPTR
jgi:branched-chain amino acid transport system substrate-binding protein